MYDSIKKFFQLLKKEKILRLLFIIIILVAVGSFGLTYFEKNTTFSNSIWWSLVTLATVGYGDIAPVTLGGRAIGVVMMFFGIGVLGLFTASVASVFVDNKFKEERGMLEIEAKNHCIICGWNYKANRIINVLGNSRMKDSPIVLLADVDVKPIEDENVNFIRGEVTEENLVKANIKDAKTVIILLDEKLDEYSRDAKAVLNTLTVGSTNPDVYTCVELVNSKNVVHCKRANANEIIVGKEFSSKLLSQAVINHGITKVISEIISKEDGNDLYKITIPPFLEGKKFLDALTILKKEHNCLTIAVQSSCLGAFMTNPSPDYVMQKDDQIVIISEKRVCF